jgi:hypothetical protein
MSDIGPWLEANQSNLIAAVVLLGVGALLAIMLRVLAVRVISAIERAVPGRSFRTSFGGGARERPVSDVVGSVVFWAALGPRPRSCMNASGPSTPRWWLSERHWDSMVAHSRLPTHGGVGA